MSDNYCYLCMNLIHPYLAIDYVTSPISGDKKMIHQTCKEKAMKKSPLQGYTFLCSGSIGLPHCSFKPEVE